MAEPLPRKTKDIAELLILDVPYQKELFSVVANHQHSSCSHGLGRDPLFWPGLVLNIEQTLFIIQLSVPIKGESICRHVSSMLYLKEASGLLASRTFQAKF